jgi:hypothetical protein
MEQRDEARTTFTEEGAGNGPFGGWRFRRGSDGI